MVGFSSDVEMPAGLEEAARIAMNQVLGAKAGERVLIITNPDRDVSVISMALYDAAIAAGASATLLYQPMKTQLDFAEDAVARAIESEPDIALSISQEKLGKDRKALKDPIQVGEKKYDSYFTYLLGEKKMRSFWSPGITVDMFAKTVPLDYDKLRSDCAVLKGMLDGAEKVRITAPAGTDLTIGLRGREARSDDGDFTKPGTGGNLPCGEVFISPELGTSQGSIFFDGSISAEEGEIIIDTPIEAVVKDGMVVDIKGKEEAAKLLETITRGEQRAVEFEEAGKLGKGDGETYARNARNLGELGIGMNPKAEIVGNMLEDEKVYRTCHIAIGSNYDEDAPALIHLDGLIKQPTIIAYYPDGSEKVIVEKGEFVR